MGNHFEIPVLRIEQLVARLFYVQKIETMATTATFTTNQFGNILTILSSLSKKIGSRFATQSPSVKTNGRNVLYPPSVRTVYCSQLRVYSAIDAFFTAHPVILNAGTWIVATACIAMFTVGLLDRI